LFILHKYLIFQLKELYNLFSFFVVVIFISSCNYRPYARFTVNGSSFSVGDTITVFNNSKFSNGTRWVVVNGAASSGSLSSHVETISGGQPCDMQYSFTIDTIGTFTMPLRAYNWKRGCEKGESGKYADYTIKIQVQ
jgi:hypothetical protein